MISGMGIDIVENKRFLDIFNTYGLRFLEKILTPEEIAQVGGKNPIHLCGLFAAKEAIIKAIGNSLKLELNPLEIQLITDGMSYKVKIDSQKVTRQLKINLSISHERLFSVAVASCL